MDGWTEVGGRDDVQEGFPLAADVGPVRVAVFEVAGALHAVEDTCPHAGASLSQGFAEGCEVECPLHNAVFDVTTGRHLRGEPCRDLATFAVRVRDDGRVEVRA